MRLVTRTHVKRWRQLSLIYVPVACVSFLALGVLKYRGCKEFDWDFSIFCFLGSTWFTLILWIRDPHTMFEREHGVEAEMRAFYDLPFTIWNCYFDFPVILFFLVTVSASLVPLWQLVTYWSICQ